IVCSLSAFGAKRTCMGVRLRRPRSWMTQSGGPQVPCRPEQDVFMMLRSDRIRQYWAETDRSQPNAVTGNAEKCGSDRIGSLTLYKDTEGPHVLSSDFAVHAEPEEFRDLSRQG